jgi:hypothetical protein
LIVNRSAASILRTATLMSFATDRTRRWKNCAGKMPLPLGFFSALTPSTQLNLIAFFVFFFVECCQGNCRKHNNCHVAPLKIRTWHWPSVWGMQANSLRTIALPVSESKGPNSRKWRTFLYVILDSSTGASWDRCGQSSDLVGKT